VHKYSISIDPALVNVLKVVTEEKDVNSRYQLKVSKIGKKVGLHCAESTGYVGRISVRRFIWSM
jgi:hypothetical protein